MSSQWNLIAYFFQKMNPVESWYKTHDGEFLAIIEAYKT